MLPSFRTAGALAITAICAMCLWPDAAHADPARKLMIHRVLCDIYEKERDNKDEKTEYVVLNQLAPDDAQVQYGFGLFLSRQKEHELAIQHLKRATQIDDNNSDYWVALANEYLQIRDYKNAEDAFQSAGPKYHPFLRIQDDIRPMQFKQYQEYNRRLKELPDDG